MILSTAQADPESFVRGGSTFDVVFFIIIILMREERIKIPL